MKREEKLANEYFTFEGFKGIQYEPDGNVPPDFLLNKSIAVEVRRLNQHFNWQKKQRSLEELEYKLIPRFRNLLLTFDSFKIDSSAFISIIYNRPLKVDKDLMREIDKILLDHIPNIKEERRFEIRDNLTIKIFPSMKRLSSTYVLGMISDHDVGGFVVSEIYKNLNLIVEEKASKIRPYLNKYNEWWLVLIDYISYGLDDLDINQLKGLPMKNQLFSKIVIVPHIDPTKGIVLDKFDDK